jgi:hypothetical protein
VKLLETGQHWDNKKGWFRRVTGFVAPPLQWNVQQGLKKFADIQGGPVF